MTTNNADDRALPPAAMLNLLEQQQRDIRRAGELQTPWYLGIWGGVWMIGYLLLGLAAVTTVVSPVVAAVVFGVLIVLGFVASAVIGVRSNRGIRGPSGWAGTIYGLSWPILSIAFGALGGGLISQGMTDDQAAVYFPSAYALMVGALYLAGAAIWRSVGQLLVGVVMIAAAAITPFLGVPVNLFVMAFGAGGVLLVAGAVSAIRLHRR